MFSFSMNDLIVNLATFDHLNGYLKDFNSLLFFIYWKLYLWHNFNFDRVRFILMVMDFFTKRPFLIIFFSLDVINYMAIIVILFEKLTLVKWKRFFSWMNLLKFYFNLEKILINWSQNKFVIKEVNVFSLV